MAWNEPGKQNNSHDGPPDLEKIFKDVSDKLGGLFGSKTSKSSKGGPTSLGPLFGIGLVIAIIIWALSGIYIVAPAEKAVVLQFGKFVRTVGNGPHWIPRFIQSETTINVDSVNNYSYSATMLTKDQNIVDVAVAVQYRVDNARHYLYNLVNPNNTVKQATASALRQVIGNSNLDDVLTSGRSVIRQNVKLQLDKLLNMYNSGVFVTDVALQPAKAPSQVKDAFDDAIKAQEDEQRYQNQAEAYVNGIIPVAEGRAKRILAQATAYKQQTVLQAQAAVAQFNAVYSVYRNSPKVTRERMYISTIENMLSKSSKIFVDTKGNNNLLYLPLEKMIQHNISKPTSLEATDGDSVSENELTSSGVLDESHNRPLSDGKSYIRPSFNDDQVSNSQGVRP